MLFKDQTITWQGEKRSFSPDIRFIRALDGKLQADPDRKTNLPQVAWTIHNGGAQYLDIPIVWAAFLEKAGFDGVDENECWGVLSLITANEASDEQRADYYSFAASLFHSLYPSADLGKLDAPAKAAKGRGAKAPRK